MKTPLFFLLNTFVCVSLFANFCDIGLICGTENTVKSQAHDFLKSTKKKLNELVKKESDIILSIANVKPNQRITKLMMEIDKIGQQLMKQEQNDEIIALSGHCLTILAVLRERRIFAYTLWAERRLEESAKVSGNDQDTLMKLYGKLSEINISIIRENMLNREIMERLAKIYDSLNPENKQKVRVNAIFQQRDAMTNIPHTHIPRRKTLDDF